MIDLWNPHTFESDLLTALRDCQNSIVNYWQEDERLMREHLTAKEYRSLGSNQYFEQYEVAVEETVAKALFGKAIRVWHYTRLFDVEVPIIRKQISLTSVTAMKHRLSEVVKSGYLNEDEQSTIVEQSALVLQNDIRAGRFWAVVAPMPVSDPAVELLLSHWGGEGVYFWLKDESLIEKLQTFGSPRVVEVSAEITSGRIASQAADIVARAWARQLSCETEPLFRDIVFRSVDNLNVIAVHTRGDALFQSVGNTYPMGAETFLQDAPFIEP